MILEFTYDASLDDIEQPDRFAGQVRQCDWHPTKHVKTTSQAALAFVRGLLNVEGVWNVVLSVDGESITRDIEVVITEDGTTFRHDMEPKS